MAKTLIASKLIDSVRNKAMIPDDRSVFDDERVLDIINEEMDIGLIDTLLELHEEHLVVSVKLEPHTVDNLGWHYIIPTRAIGNRLRDVFYVNGTNFWELNRIDLDEIGDYRYYDNIQTMGADLFFLQGDEIIVVNSPMHGTTTLTAYFYIRPSEIVLEEECAKIQSIDRNTGIIQLIEIPKTFNGTVEFDFIQDENPNKILGINTKVISTNINTRTMTLNPQDIPSRLKEGDWICVKGTSPYPNVPMELHPVLSQRAAVAILESLGDNENLGSANAKLRRIEKSVQKTLNNRVEGAPKKIKNRYSTLNSTALYNRRRGRR